jgi:hypothetical protein
MPPAAGLVLVINFSSASECTCPEACVEGDLHPRGRVDINMSKSSLRPPCSCHGTSASASPRVDLLEARGHFPRRTNLDSSGCTRLGPVFPTRLRDSLTSTAESMLHCSHVAQGFSFSAASLSWSRARTPVHSTFANTTFELSLPIDCSFKVAIWGSRDVCRHLCCVIVRNRYGFTL